MSDIYQIPLYSELVSGKKKLVGYATIDDSAEVELTVDDPETVKMLNLGIMGGLSIYGESATLIKENDG